MVSIVISSVVTISLVYIITNAIIGVFVLVSDIRKGRRNKGIKWIRLD